MVGRENAGPITSYTARVIYGNRVGGRTINSVLKTGSVKGGVFKTPRTTSGQKPVLQGTSMAQSNRIL